jgi:hypothetical protein
MSKYGAKEAFEKLAAAYLTVCKSSDAETFVKDLREEHKYHLDDYYYTKDRREHSGKALKNDLRGALRNER